ncbi:PAS domain-containing protein, partial [Kineococcus glutinatus]|uniref:PAS domain-containing protein n=1 Tax=Kineococcus glutinatus TaxID=1070872 RepID=UPI0031EEEA16
MDGRLARVRFYASAPLVTPEGYALGSLCVFDTVPGTLSAERAAVLQDLASVLVALFERRRQARLAERFAAEAEEQRMLVELTMAEAEARWELSEVVAETVDVGLVICDPDGRLVSFNRAARAWHGLDADTDLAPAEHARTYALLAADGTTPLAPADVPLHRVLREGAVEGVEMVIAPPGRPAVRVVCSGRALRRRDGSPLGAVMAMTDVTASRLREAALTTAHAELHEQVARVKALAGASRRVAAAENPRAVICRTVCELTGADGAYLLQPDGRGGLVSTALVGSLDVPVRFDLEVDMSMAITSFTDRT